MADLTANRTPPITYGETKGFRRDYEVKDGAVIYRGSFVFESGTDGYASPTAGDANLFLGVAQEKADNTGGADAAKTVATTCGAVIKHAVTGVTAATNKGAAVYAVDNQTLSLTSTTNPPVGWIVDWVSGTTCFIRCKEPGQPIS